MVKIGSAIKQTKKIETESFDEDSEDDLDNLPGAPSIVETTNLKDDQRFQQLEEKITILNKTLAGYRHESALARMNNFYFLNLAWKLARKYAGGKKRWKNPGNEEVDHLEYMELQKYMETLK